MPTEAIDLVGLVAGSLTTLSFIPQVLKIWRTKFGTDISAGMFVLFSLGVLLWLIYGLALAARPVIIANAATLVLALIVMVLKFRYRQTK